MSCYHSDQPWNTPSKCQHKGKMTFRKSMIGRWKRAWVRKNCVRRDTADYASLCGTPMTQRKERVDRRRYVGYEIHDQIDQASQTAFARLVPFLAVCRAWGSRGDFVLTRSGGRSLMLLIFLLHAVVFLECSSVGSRGHDLWSRMMQGWVSCSRLCRCVFSVDAGGRLSSSLDIVNGR